MPKSRPFNPNKIVALLNNPRPIFKEIGSAPLGTIKKMESWHEDEIAGLQEYEVEAMEVLLAFRHSLGGTQIDRLRATRFLDHDRMRKAVASQADEEIVRREKAKAKQRIGATKRFDIYGELCLDLHYAGLRDKEIAELLDAAGCESLGIDKEGTRKRISQRIQRQKKQRAKRRGA